MLVGVPKEIKNHEYRVGLTPISVAELVRHGHQVWVETNAGVGIGCSDADYQAAGAQIQPSAGAIFAQAQLVVKVKEPQAQECQQLRAGQLLFTYLHLAPDPQQAQLLQASGCSAIAYETVTATQGGLPLLAPMSEVAGRMAIQAGAHYLEKAQGGRGVLLGGVPGVAPGKVVILGGGMVGSNAAEMALGLGAQVVLLDKDVNVLRRLTERFGPRLQTLYSTASTICEQVRQADLLVGAVLVPGAAAPKLVSAELIAQMQPGAVVVDVAIDQGGCFATSHATTHAEPVYKVGEVLHYCVANMPGAVARTSTFALNNATLPFVIALANNGLSALRHDIHLCAGLNVHAGHITHPAVAQALGLACRAPKELLWPAS